MDNEIKKALKKLPSSVQQMFSSLRQGDDGEAVARRYLLLQLKLVSPKLKLPPLNPKSVISGEELEFIKGKATTVKIHSQLVQAVETDDGIWIPKAWLCRAFGWHGKKLSDVPEVGNKARHLNTAGFSFKHRKVQAVGYKAPWLTAIPIEDAVIAADVFEGRSKNAA